MTVYDCANELAREMRATREFSVLKEAKEKLSAEPDTKALIARFMQLGQEVEIARYQKKEVPAETFCASGSEKPSILWKNTAGCVKNEKTANKITSFFGNAIAFFKKCGIFCG